MSDAGDSPGAKGGSFKTTATTLALTLLLGTILPLILAIADRDGLALKVMAKGRLYLESELVTEDACDQNPIDDRGCLVVAPISAVQREGAIPIGTLVRASSSVAVAAREDDIQEGVAIEARRVGLPSGPTPMASTAEGARLLASAVEWAAGPGRESYRGLVLLSVSSSPAEVEVLVGNLIAALPSRWEVSVVPAFTPTGEAGESPEGQYDVLLVGHGFDTEQLPAQIRETLSSTPIVTWSTEGWERFGIAAAAEVSGHSVIDIDRPGHDLVDGLYGSQATAGADNSRASRALWIVLAAACLFGAVAFVAFVNESKYRTRQVPVARLPATLRFSHSYENQRRADWNLGVRWMLFDFIVLTTVAVLFSQLILSRAGEGAGEPEGLRVLPDLTGGLTWAAFGLLVVIVTSAWFSYLNLKPFRRVAEVATTKPTSKVARELDPVGPERVAVCISGGGIRAAAFGLGGIQALQDRPIWNGVDRLTAVSGGAYTAASYSLLRKRDVKHPYELHSDEMQRLRNNTHYLAPGANGAFRAFTAWLAGFVWNVALVASLVWTCAVLGALIVKSQAYLPQLDAFPDMAAGLVPFIDLSSDSPAALFAFAILGILAGIHVVLLLLISGSRAWSEGNRRIVQGHIFALLTLVLILWVIPRALQIGGWIGDLIASAPQLASSIAGLATVGWVAAIVRGLVAGRGARIAQRLAGLVLPIAVLAYFVWAAWVNVTLDAGRTLLWIAVSAAIIIVSNFLPARRVSLHGFYTDRLIDGFASNSEGPFDANLSELKTTPKLDIAAVANLGPGPVTPPGRSALPWVFNATYTGLESDGSSKSMLADTRTVADVIAGGSKYKLTTMASVAISGAAFSPAMGRRTLRSFRALLAILNLRLGVWLPNPLFRDIWTVNTEIGTVPGFTTDTVARKEFSRSPGQFPNLLKEALGLHRPDAAHLYITDGGHYDNLGLVSLLRLGYQTIICFDASADGAEGFTTIADAMMLARAELGIDIDLDPEEDGLWPLDLDSEFPDAALSVFPAATRFEDGTNGRLIYCRASITRSTPWSIDSYRRRDPTFPNTSTLKQLFGDETFEAYRSLGYTIGAIAASKY